MTGLPDNATEKAALRLQARAIRQTLDTPALSELLCERIAALPGYQAAGHVLLYLAMPGEITVEKLLTLNGSEAKRFYVPRCAPQRRLAIHPYVSGKTPLGEGPFGIREPDPAFVPEVEPDRLDLVVVPALFLSEASDRLGYGGGYYDRFLPRLLATCLKIGVLPDALVLPSLPRDPWDIPLDMVLTEKRLPVRPQGE